MNPATRYEGPALTGSLAQDIINRVLVVTSATTAAAEVDLYFIEASDERLHESPIKIGVSGNVINRLSALQTSCPYRLTLRRHAPRLGIVERTLHRLFREFRTFGEWFEPAPAVVAAADDKMPADLVLNSPSLDGQTPWSDISLGAFGLQVDKVWPIGRHHEVWSDSQRLLRNTLRYHRTIGEAWEAARAEDAALGGAA